ncbi:hypothetical protein HKCCSP123_07995 [Rhodobacterales bacterium HKCCSP123]|nr:hypothetical protein [Rhodobacterales bacterium HKCCSP123]
MTPKTTGTQMGASAQQTQSPQQGGGASSQQQSQQSGQTRQPGGATFTDWASI